MNEIGERLFVTFKPERTTGIRGSLTVGWIVQKLDEEFDEEREFAQESLVPETLATVQTQSFRPRLALFLRSLSPFSLSF